MEMLILPSENKMSCCGFSAHIPDGVTGVSSELVWDEMIISV